MTAGLICLAAALLTWPRRSTLAPLPVTVSKTNRRGLSLDGVVPQLLGGAVGLLLLFWDSSPIGVVIAVAGGVGSFLVLRRARTRSAAAERLDSALPITLTVAGLLLRSGHPPPLALAVAARSCRSRSAGQFEAIHRRIAMGENAREAWHSLLPRPQVAAVARAALRASDSGAALAAAWESTADQVRKDQRLAAEVAARKVGVSALAPLGLCFLPSFICLGVIPIVIGLAGDIL